MTTDSANGMESEGSALKKTTAPTNVPTTTRQPSSFTFNRHDEEAADEQGLRDAYLTHGAEMLRFARRSLASSSNAQDAVQETFARAWRSRSRFDPTLGSLRTWLFTIERRVLIDMLSQSSKSSTTNLGSNFEPTSVDRIESAMLGWQVESALDRLPPEHRTVLTEIYFNGRSGREVAELFAIPEGTVRSRAFYALRTMRLYLEEAGWIQ